MKVKLDENIPTQLAEILATLGHEADTVADEKLKGQPDPTIWQAAQDSERFLITQDLDFSDIRAFVPGSHHGVLLVRLGNPSRRALLERLKDIFAAENVESWTRCFVVVTDRKLRLRKPKVYRNSPE
jgi:predicted nuclease of predicted toxin-antitoxin system